METELHWHRNIAKKNIIHKKTKIADQFLHLNIQRFSSQEKIKNSKEK